MKHRHIPTLTIALALVACTPQQAPEAPLTAASATSSATTSTSAHPQEQQSRGYQQSPLPDFLITPWGNTAAEFVRIAATPDTRIDPTPTSTWQRASRLLTPELANEVTTQKNTIGGSWWTELVKQDGYITIEITNVTGETPQAPYDPTPEEKILEVMYTRVLHHRTYEQQDEKLYVWTVALDKNGKIATFTTDH